MKKYNLSKIMKRAWELKKQDSRNIFSLCLKMAWEEEKKETKKIKFSGYAKVAILDNGETNPNIGKEYDSEANYFVFRMWNKGDYKRIYINDYKGRSMGYIDCKNGNKLGNKYPKRVVVETTQYFLENYEF